MVITYFAVAVIVAIPASVFIVRAFTYSNKPDGADWMGAVMIGCFAGLLWPVALPVAIIGLTAKWLYGLIYGGKEKRVKLTKR